MKQGRYTGQGDGDMSKITADAQKIRQSSRNYKAMYKVRKGEIEKQVTSEVGMPLLFEEKTSYHDQLQIYMHWRLL